MSVIAEQYILVSFLSIMGKSQEFNTQMSNINLLLYKLVIWLVNQKIADIIQRYTLTKLA